MKTCSRCNGLQIVTGPNYTTVRCPDCAPKEPSLEAIWSNSIPTPTPVPRRTMSRRIQPGVYRCLMGDNVFALGTRLGLVVVSWRKDCTLEHIARLNQAMDDLQAATGTAYAVLAILNPGLGRPADEIQAAMAQSAQARKASIIASAQVVRPDGLAGIIVRAALVGLRVVFKSPFPMNSFGTVPAATEWLLPFVKAARLSAADITTMVEDVESQW